MRYCLHENRHCFLTLHKKDFVDLFFILQKYPLDELLAFFEKKYTGIAFNTAHILRNLVFFDDADAESMQMMTSDAVAWEGIKQHIQKVVYSKVP